MTVVLDIEKVPQPSVDGPNVIWDMFQTLHQKHKENEHSVTINIGSCGLYRIHGAFQIGFKSQNWNFDKIFRAMYNMFSDSLARCKIYICDSIKFACE